MALTKVTGQVIKNTTDVTVGVLTVTNTLAVGGTVSIGGTLTYEDVTNVDAVGLITARNGIVVGSGITLSKDGDIFATGVTTSTTFVGDLTGDVTGAATQITVAGETSDTTCFPVFVTTSTGNQAPKTRGTLTFNSSSGALGASSFVGGTISGTTGTFTGDVDIADTIVHTGDTDTKIRFPAADTFTVETGGSERVRVTSDGKLALGVASPVAVAHIEGGSEGNLFQLSNTHTGTTVSDGFVMGINSSSTYIFNRENTAIRIGTNNTERLRITSDGKFGFNVTAPSNDLVLKSTAAHTSLLITSGDESTKLSLQTVQGSDVRVGTVSNHPLTFYSNSLERARIDSNGNMGLGSSPLSRLSVTDALSSGTMMTIRNTQSRADGVRYGIEFRDSSNEANGTISMEQTGSNNGAEMRFNINNGTGGNGITNGTNSVTFEAGSQFFNCTSSPSSGTSGQRCESGGTFVIGVSVTTAKNAVEINNPNGNVGRITSSGSGVTYHTSSDYRLKENETTISDGITRLKTLIPRKFNWKSDSTKTLEDGFFAHEVSSVVPEAIDGAKDAVYAEDDLDRGITKGDPIYQMIDHSRLVPLLTAALQEAITKIETLEAEVAALKSS